MTLREFLAWDAPWGPAWQLVDGEPRSMEPTSRTHGTIQAALGMLIGNHFRDRGSPCSIVSAPGAVPRIRSDSNFRIPDPAVTCMP
jgi:Uma2 family endonuclease